MMATAFSFVALGLSLFLLSVGKSGRGLPGCGANSGCGTLTKGRWALWLGIPTAALAIPVYLAVLIGMWGEQGHSELRQQALQVLAIWIAGSAIWFIALQALVVRRYCVYCLLIHACGLVSAASILAMRQSVPVGSHCGILVVGMAGLALLIGGQVLLPGRTFAVESSGPVVPAESLAAVAAPPPNPAAPEPLARTLTHRTISLLSGKIVLEPDTWPLLGEPTAPQVVAWMFDYTCVECHYMHQLLHQALEKRKGTLAVILLPVPANSACNPTVKHNLVEHTLACAYARLGLALGVANPAAYQLWDEFLRGESVPQPYGLALKKAQQLADPSRDDFRMPNQLLDAQILAAVQIFQQTHAQTTPALILPTAILTGHVPDVTGLLKIIDRQFQPIPQITVLR